MLKFLFTSHTQLGDPVHEALTLVGGTLRDGVSDEFLVGMASPDHACACEVGIALDTAAPEDAA